MSRRLLWRSSRVDSLCPGLCAKKIVYIYSFKEETQTLVACFYFDKKRFVLQFGYLVQRVESHIKWPLGKWAFKRMKRSFLIMARHTKCIYYIYHTLHCCLRQKGGTVSTAVVEVQSSPNVFLALVIFKGPGGVLGGVAQTVISGPNLISVTTSPYYYNIAKFWTYNWNVNIQQVLHISNSGSSVLPLDFRALLPTHPVEEVQHYIILCQRRA